MLTRGAVWNAEFGAGEPICDTVLRGAVIDVVGRVDRALGLPRGGASPDRVTADVATARAELAARVVRLAEELRRPRDADRWSSTRDQLVDLLLDVRRIAERLEAEAHRNWASTFQRVGVAVALVRRARTLGQLLAEAPTAVVALGFRRAMVSSVRDDALVPEHAHDEDDPEGGDQLVRAARDPVVALDRALRESDMVRGRSPIVVPDARRDPRVHPALARTRGWQSYVAALVVVHGEVAGFVHAARWPAPVGQIDAEGLGVLADALGQAYERHAAARRSEEARSRVRRALEAVDGAFLDGPDGAFAPVTGSARAGIDEMLTVREREVLRLMAAGATNAAIAVTLVIAEGTAKTHVKNILRKLEAGNRAEAVSRFLGGVGNEADTRV